MRITRRKDEIAQIVALLEDDSYDLPDGYCDEERLAADLFQLCADLIAARHLYVVVARDFRDVGWGVYATVLEAEKAWERDIAPAIGAGGGFILPVAPWHTEAHETKTVPPTALCTCGHPKWHHLDTTKGRSTTARTTRCNTPKEKCPCPVFTAPTKEAKP